MDMQPMMCEESVNKKHTTTSLAYWETFHYSHSFGVPTYVRTLSLMCCVFVLRQVILKLRECIFHVNIDTRCGAANYCWILLYMDHYLHVLKLRTFADGVTGGISEDTLWIHITIFQVVYNVIGDEVLCWFESKYTNTHTYVL